MAKRFTIVPKATEKKCTACNGSGYYDCDGSPKCDSCNGTGIKKD